MNNALNAIALVAEQKIREAQERGELDNLPPESRMAYTILKNSGYLQKSERAVPPEMALKTDNPDEGKACGKLRRLNFILRRIHKKRGKNTPLEPLPPLPDSPYLEDLLKRI